MRTKLFILLILLLSFSTLFSDIVNYDKAIRNLKGIKSYEKEDFDSSEESFKRNSIEYPKDARLHYNQANAQVKKGMLEEAEQNYKLALNNDKFKDRSKALQNLGNVKFLQKDYKNAIKNYRDALVEDSQNLDARYNYELAARMLQRQQEQKQQQQQNKDNSDDKKDKDKQEQKQQQQKQDQKDDKKQEQQQKQDEQKQDEKQKSQEQKLKEQKKEDAEKMLKALLQKEKEEMKKEKEKMNVDRTKTGKYW